MPPPKPSPSPQLDEEAMARASAQWSPLVSGLSAEEAENPGGRTEMAEAAAAAPEQRPRAPYTIPLWSAAPRHPFFLEVIKNGIAFGRLDVSQKACYMFGRMDLCDFVLEHPSISGFHAVIQFRNNGEVFLYDFGSTHGSFINKTQIKERIYTKIHVGDFIKFGQSSCFYAFRGPSELVRLDGEDEITWQNYKGQLTDRQENIRSKIIKQMEEVDNMKREIYAIRMVDISQAGLTQGQQTQITRNKQRILQNMEDLKNLEETLNESIQESLGAHAGNPKCDSHRASIEEDVIFSEPQSDDMANSLLEKKDNISGTKSKRKLVEEERNSQRGNADLRDDDGCSRDSIKQKSSSLTTIDSLPPDMLLEVFLRLPSIECVIRAACSHPVWKNAIAASPLFRRKFLGRCQATLLGLFFDPPSTIAPAFPTFVPARNTTVDVPVAVRWGDFFITELQRQPVVPPNWFLSDVRGGLMLLVNPDDVLLVVDPLRGQSEGLFNPHEVRILMDYHGTNPRVLQAHLVCDEAYRERFTLVCFAHDTSRVRAAVFSSTIGGRGFTLPWFEVAPRHNQLDEEDGWLTEGVQAGQSIYWLSRNHQYVVVLDTTTLVFSVEDLPDLHLNNLDNYTFGETRDGKLCLAYTHGPRLVVMCSGNNNNVSGPWDILHEVLLQDLASVHGELRVSSVRKGIAYLMASRGFYEYGIPCWIATYDMQTHEAEVKCQWMSSDLFQPFHLPWPKFLSRQGQASAEKAQRHLHKFEKINATEDIVLVKAIYSCQMDVMKNPQNYKAWHKYIELEKTHGDNNKVRDIYEKALSSLPIEDEKWFWDSYISLWISFASYEEEAGNIESARQIYTRCLGVVSQQSFTFSIVWTMAADLEIKQRDVEAARQILRAGIEKRPNAKLYRKLIDIEYGMNNHDVWRGLFETFVQLFPVNCGGWMDYAEKEHKIGEAERARAVYERAIQQVSLDLPLEVLLKDYLYFEICENEADNARALFEKLLLVTNDVQAWISYAKYEASDDCNTSMMERIQNCRLLFERALGHYSNSWEIDERATLIQAWTEHEKSFGVWGAAISPEQILSSTLKRKRSSSHDIAGEKRRKKDAGDDYKAR